MDGVMKDRKVEVDWKEYEAFNNWRQEKLIDLVNPVQEFVRFYMPTKTIQITKDYWKLEEN